MIIEENDVLFVFDEVMIGFCIVYGGVQEKFNVILDLIILGKIIGGGLLVGVYGGCQDIMLMVVLVGLMY